MEIAERNPRSSAATIASAHGILLLAERKPKEALVHCSTSDKYLVDEFGVQHPARLHNLNRIEEANRQLGFERDNIEVAEMKLVCEANRQRWVHKLDQVMAIMEPVCQRALVRGNH